MFFCGLKTINIRDPFWGWPVTLFKVIIFVLLCFTWDNNSLHSLRSKHYNLSLSDVNLTLFDWFALCDLHWKWLWHIL